jgi:putative addiction module component (TIGR02574 family)
MPSAQSLLEQVLGLPESERFHLVEALLTSLSSASEKEESQDGEEDRELSAELQRRGDELLANPSSAMSWNEVQRLADAELKELGKDPCPWRVRL